MEKITPQETFLREGNNYELAFHLSFATTDTENQQPREVSLGYYCSAK